MQQFELAKSCPYGILDGGNGKGGQMDSRLDPGMFPTRITGMTRPQIHQLGRPGFPAFGSLHPRIPNSGRGGQILRPGFGAPPILPPTTSMGSGRP